MIDECDVIVLGAGPAGAACARELALKGHGVHLVTSQRRQCTRFRETASSSLARLLANEMLPLPQNCSRRISKFSSAWGADELELRSSHFYNLHDDIALDRIELDQWYISQALKAGVRIESSCVVGVNNHKGSWYLEMDGGRSGHGLKCRFLVEATGRTANSLCQPQVKRLYTDQLACVYLVACSRSYGDLTAFVESAEIGWWYVVDDPPSIFLALFTDADQIPNRSERRSWFENSLFKTRHVKQVVNPIAAKADIFVRDARTSIRTLLWRETWLAVGDASWSLDPLSGNGYERAVLSGMAAGRAISQSIHSESDYAIREFAMHQADSFHAALELQHKFYTRETRFNSPFWQRRCKQEISSAGTQ